MKKMKISIRVNILTIFTTLLIIIGTAIIFINYRAGSNILLQFAEKLVVSANSNIELQVYNYLWPLGARMEFGARSIKYGLVDLRDKADFDEFLTKLFIDQQSASGIHWSDAEGNLDFIERGKDGVFTNEVVSCVANQCVATTRQLDSNGKALSAPVVNPTVIDPRTRPWYIKATKARHPILSDVYLFAYHPGLGVTTSTPVYDANNNLLGVLSIDMYLNALSSFISDLKLTPNANIFIFDAQNNIIAAQALQHFTGKTLPKVEDIKAPWVPIAIKQYQKTKKNSFSYIYQKERYLAHYSDISSIVGNPWYIGIILPESDITAPMMHSLANSILIALAILFLGILLVLVVSKNISRPIVRLAHDAHFIKELMLDKIKYLKLSYIKEICYLQEAFTTMKQSLSSFIRYVPASLVKKLMTTGEIAHVGGESKEITFLFVDIEGFTALSEGMEPKALMHYLSEYLEAMTKIIFDYKGTVDKYMGDAIMAFWGAPEKDEEQALHACQCAFAIFKELDKLNHRFTEAQLPTIKIRIGVHSGTAVIGNVGSEDRLSYTALGDSVNLASRLENVNKLYETAMIVSETTYHAVRKNYDFRLLDYVAVRGKQQGVHIYEPIAGQYPHALDKINIAEYNQKFMAAFSLYKKGNWQAAAALFAALNMDYPHDNLAKIYLKRCAKFKNHPPLGWNGIWRIS